MTVEVDNLKESNMELKDKISRLEKSNEVAASGLHNVKEQYWEIMKVVAPLVDVLVPTGEFR